MLYLAELLTILFAFFNSKEQVEANYLYSQTNPDDLADRKKALHFANGERTIAYCLICALTQSTILLGIAAFLLCGLIYFISFTIAYNLGIDKDWYFVGQTAKTDQMIRRFLGENGMKKVIGISILLVFVANVLTAL